MRSKIQIDRALCIGCGACVSACEEGAIALVDGKATLVNEAHCDGLGKCLPKCPVDALSLMEHASTAEEPKGCADGCPGAALRELRPLASSAQVQKGESPSCLAQWPVQIALLPIQAPYYANADILVAADCASYAYGSFHDDYMRGRITMIGCPKLDDGDYSGKLAEILKRNEIQTLTVARMEVPCCTGIEHAVKAAVMASGKEIPVTVSVITTDGKAVV